ncbi:MAG: hypothetical protein C0392_13455 [Syntrophus sp. (in: bacteria)]|nr:hypothetical protein [Syntrophus sp. (in: bacteria)]
MLRASIEKVGIIQPALLFGPCPYTIIAGFKKVQMAIELGYVAIPAIILSNIDEKEALLYAIHDNLIRGLNTVEKALAIEKMSRMDFPMPPIFDTMVFLGLKPHEKVRAIHSAIAHAEEPMKALIVSKNLSMKNIETLLRFDRSERGPLLGLLSTVHVTEGSLREILGMMILMKIREGQIDFDGFSGVGSADDLKRILKGRMYPILTSLETKLEHIRQQSALPPHVDIKVDPFFEKEYIDIGIRAKDIKDVEYALERLRKALEGGSIGSMLELTKG